MLQTPNHHFWGEKKPFVFVGWYHTCFSLDKRLPPPKWLPINPSQKKKTNECLLKKNQKKSAVVFWIFFSGGHSEYASVWVGVGGIGRVTLGMWPLACLAARFRATFSRHKKQIFSPKPWTTGNINIPANAIVPKETPTEPFTLHFLCSMVIFSIRCMMAQGNYSNGLMYCFILTKMITCSLHFVFCYPFCWLIFTLPKTKCAPKNRQTPKRNRSSSNHPFSDAKMWVSERIIRHPLSCACL